MPAMAQAPKPTTFDRLTPILAAVLGVAGGAALITSLFMRFSDLALTLAGVLLIFSSVLIAGSKGLAAFITKSLK